MQERKRRSTSLKTEYISNLLKQLQDSNYMHNQDVIELLKNILKNPYTEYKHIDTIGKLEDAMRDHAMDHVM